MSLYRARIALLRVVRKVGIAFALTLGASAILALGTRPATAADGAALALGDSVAFGYIDQAGYAYVNPRNFVGYPYYVAGETGLTITNAACPGETTSSFMSSAGGNTGCTSFRSNFPLHVGYRSTQLNFAISFLEAHRRTRLVTINLGANDVFLLQDSCSGDIACIQAGLPAILAAVGRNMDKLLQSIHATEFGGVLLVVNYYSLDYTDPIETGATIALNRTLAAVAKAHGALVADVFSAFQTAASSPFAGGKTCRAGLLNADVQNPTLCDVHPSQSGQQLIATTVEAMYRNAVGAEKDE